MFEWFVQLFSWILRHQAIDVTSLNGWHVSQKVKAKVSTSVITLQISSWSLRQRLPLSMFVERSLVVMGRKSSSDSQALSETCELEGTHIITAAAAQQLVKAEGHGGISNREKQLILNLGTSVNIDPDTQKGRTWLKIFAAPGPLNSHWISLRVFCFTLFYPGYMHLISHLGMVEQIQHITHDFMGVNKSFFSKVVTGIDHATDMMYHIRYGVIYCISTNVEQLKQGLFVVIPLADPEIIVFSGNARATSESTKLTLSFEAYLIATVSGLHPCDWIHVNSLYCKYGEALGNIHLCNYVYLIFRCVNKT